MLFKTRYAYYDCQYYFICMPMIELLDDEIKALETILKDMLTRYNCTIDTIMVLSDQVHLLLNIGINIPVLKIANVLKGYSSFLMRKQFPRLKEYPHLWYKGFYLLTVGEITDKKIARGIRKLSKKKES